MGGNCNFSPIFTLNISMKKKMKEVYGEKAGTVIHIISYTIVPIAVGIVGIVAYCLGIKVF